jgi:hypothetical protein
MAGGENYVSFLPLPKFRNAISRDANSSCSAIFLSSMTDLDNEHAKHAILNVTDNAIVTNAIAPVMTEWTGQRLPNHPRVTLLCDALV